MELTVFVIFLFAISIWFYFWKISRAIKASNLLISLLFMVKIGGALVIWNYYDKQEDRLHADIFKYYDDGQRVKSGMLNHPEIAFDLLFFANSDHKVHQRIAFDCGNWETKNPTNNFMGNRLMIRFNAILSLLFGTNYFLHLLIFSALSFIGIILVNCALNIQNKILSMLSLVMMTLSPSLLFWTSGVLKESLIIFFVGVLFYQIRKTQTNDKKWLNYFIGIFSLVMIWVLRASLGYCLLAPLLFGLLYSVMTIWTKYSLISTLGIVGIVSILFLHFNGINEHEVISERHEEFLMQAEEFEAGSTYLTPLFQDNIELLYKGPIAAYNALFRPSILEIKKLSYLPFALESIFVIFLLVLSIIFGKRQNINQSKEIFSIIIFVAGMATIIGLTVPIFGASVRYRAPLILIIFILCLIYFDPNSIQTIKRKIQKINP